MRQKKILFLPALVLLFLAFPSCAAFAQESVGGTDIVARAAHLVFQVSIILFSAWIGGAIFNRLSLPSVLGEVISGVIIGPYLLGSLPFLSFPNGAFPLQGSFPISTELYSLTVIASIVLLFLVGVETDIELLFRFSAAGLVVGIGGVIASFILGDLVGVLFGKALFGIELGFAHPIPLFLGVVSTATSVGITARILSDKHKMDSPEGVTILSAAVIDDVLGIIAFAIVIGIIRSGHVVWKEVSLISLKAIGIWLGFTILGLTFSKYLSRFLKNFRDRATMAVMGFALALLLAGIFEKSGLAMIIGAYVMGISLSKTDISFLIQENLAALHKFFVPLFFCVMGMLINFREMMRPDIMLFGLAYMLFAVVGKIAGCGFPALFMNFNFRGASRIGMGMVPRGEVALIIAGIGLALRVIPHEIFSISVIMTFITTLVTPPILDRMLNSDAPVLRKAPPARKEIREIRYAMPNPETEELIVGRIIADFESEGFFVYRVEIPSVLYHIRKNEIFIILRQLPEELVFECSANDAPFVNTVFYEVLAELEELIKRLEKISDREKIGKEIFEKEAGLSKEHVKLSQIINPAALTLGLKGSTKDEILEELVDLFVRSGQLALEKRDEVMRDLKDREATMSTGMQEGVALPHTKTLAIDHLIGAVGLKKEGVDFDSLDKKPSTIFVITLAPKTNQQPYLQFMSEMTKILISADNRKKILAAESIKDLYQILTSAA